MGGGDISDEDLMLRYRDGDPSAFETLYTRHRGPLYRYMVRHCTDRAVAEELFQDVWMRIVKARDRYEVKAKFTTLLYRIARNRFIDHIRAHKPTLSLVNDEDDDESAALEDGLARPADQQLETVRTGERVRQAISALPADQRDAFLLHEEAGLTLEEIAEVMGVGRETVKSRLRYAVGKLRNSLEAQP